MVGRHPVLAPPRPVRGAQRPAATRDGDRPASRGAQRPAGA
eukprot:COSAG06_NODE_2150_length_7468_cov_21.810286_4_plen_40_part_01